MATVLVIGAFDTKGAEYDFLLRQVASQGCGVLTMNVGVMGTTDLFPVDVEADEVARAGGAELRALRAVLQKEPSHGGHQQDEQRLQAVKDHQKCPA